MSGQVTLNFQLNDIGPCCTNHSNEISLALTNEISSYNGDYSKLVDDIVANRQKVATWQQEPKNPCDGCKYWKEDEKVGDHVFANPIQRLIINNYRTCNLKCVYCPRVDLKRPPGYEVYPILKAMIQKPGFFAPEQTWLTWAGGEPSLYPKDDMRRSVDLAMGARMLVRFNTNAVSYSSLIAETLADYEDAVIICSLDSGNKENYAKIKGADRFDKVLENLKRYHNICQKSQLHIKFIECEENSDSVEGFLKLIDENDFNMVYVEDRQKGIRVGEKRKQREENLRKRRENLKRREELKKKKDGQALPNSRIQHDS